jgi:hypothetical protein
MGRYFNHADVFPIIADSIRKIYQRKKAFTSHEEIVHGLLNDPTGKELVDAACKKHPSQSHEGMAGVMIAWFSQKITVGKSEYANEFERKKVGNKWAYKPIGYA